MQMLIIAKVTIGDFEDPMVAEHCDNKKCSKNLGIDRIELLDDFSR